ncbi:hypothetical protein [Amycolatopsis suaedae]|uniref:hypothetical protein n=1 Tax=Amycolatopsis suaedae TaxID=2510978 RepID=UPI00196ABF0F|nr:hypothetical protein [Amycolatopsis suaedae]
MSEEQAALPPMPDRMTGDPRPPRAPVRSSKKPGPKQPYHDKKVLPGPSDAGPPLEWDYGDRRLQLWAAATMLVLGIALAFFKEGFDWLDNWSIWLGLVVISGLFSLLLRGHKISAGADWLNTRGGIVRTYELTEVNFDTGPYGTPVLQLKDKHGGEADAQMTFMESNRELWDLVYNGILHSLANGATMNKRAQREFPIGDRIPRTYQPLPPGGRHRRKNHHDGNPNPELG